MTHPASPAPDPERGPGTGSITASTDLTGSPPVSREPADVVAAAVAAVAGVAALHSGMFGEVGTYLPGRRVSGVRMREGGTDIHVSVFFGAPVRAVAEQVRHVVAALVPGPVHVTVEDVLPTSAGSPWPQL